jgi:hypothetical protein
MTAIVITFGLVLLVGVAVVIGMVLAGERDHRERLRLDALRWRLWNWEQEIISAAECRGCPSCELLRRRADLQRGPLG